MKVLLISHTCQSRTEGQPKAHALSAIAGLDLRVVVPRIWKRYGKWRKAEAAEGNGFEFSAERVCWPWVGPAQTYLHWYPRLRQILLEFKPDIIDVWEEPWSLAAGHACWLRDRVLPDAKIVVETEQNLFKVLPPPFEQIRRYVLNSANFVVGRNSEAISVVRKKGFIGPAAVVPNGVDTQMFRPMDRAACRAELGLGGFVVGYVGRLVESKGILDLLEAVEQCPGHVTLLMAGSGPLEERVQQYSLRARMQGRLRLLPARALEELPQVFAAMDVLAVPSRTTARWKEQFGRVIIEAHACGVPVIGSNSGAIPDVVGQGGLIVPEGSVSQLRSTIERLSADPELCRQMGEAGFAQAQAQCTWNKVADHMHDIYQKTLAMSKPGIVYSGAIESLA